MTLIFKYRWGSELLRQSDVVLTTKANTSLLVASETAAKPTGGRKLMLDWHAEKMNASYLEHIRLSKWNLRVPRQLT